MKIEDYTILDGYVYTKFSYYLQNVLHYRLGDTVHGSVSILYEEFKVKNPNYKYPKISKETFDDYKELIDLCYHSNSTIDEIRKGIEEIESRGNIKNKTIEINDR